MQGTTMRHDGKRRRIGEGSIDGGARTGVGRLLLLGAVLALAVALVACGGSDDDAGSPAPSEGTQTAADPEQSSMTLGLPVVTSTFAPMYLAVQEGYFEEEGLDVEIVHFRGGSDLVKGIASGSVDVGYTALAGPMTAIAQGRPLKVFYGGFNMTLFEWWASPPISSVQEAKGKRWGVSRVGSSTDFLTRYLLEQNGLNPQTDAKIVSGGGSAGRLAAQQEGQLDVNIFSVPETFKADEAGYQRIADQADLMDGYPFHVAFTQESFLQENPNTIEAFLRGLVKGIERAKSDPKAAQDVIVERVKIEEKYAAQTVQAYIDQVYADGRLPSDKAMDIFWQIGIDNGQFKEEIPKSEWLVTKWMDSYPQWVEGQ